jgi:hypothetical protein
MLIKGGQSQNVCTQTRVKKRLDVNNVAAATKMTSALI